MKFLHKKFIEGRLKAHIKDRTPLVVGNHLNEYFTFADAEAYANKLKKSGDDRVSKSSKDVINGRIAEEILVYLLEASFKHNGVDFEVMGMEENKDFLNKFKIVHGKLSKEKVFDVDIFIKKRGNEKKFYLLSVKGTARERIGQFISNLFLMDDRLIKEKYSDRYYLEFKNEGIDIKYGFVCYDWAKDKDFARYTKKRKQERKTMKATEVLLINDDDYMGGGVSVLNDEKNLEGVINFGQLVARIMQFLD